MSPVKICLLSNNFSVYQNPGDGCFRSRTRHVRENTETAFLCFAIRVFRGLSKFDRSIQNGNLRELILLTAPDLSS